MHIHARSLNYFDMIRRCGSIREAARRLHLASSAVNRQLLKLEEEIGAELFERLPSGLKLTAAGEIFAGHVITVLQDEQRLVGELDSLRGLRRGDLGVLGVEGLNSEFLPAVLERRLKRYPLLRVRTRTTGSTAIAQAVIEGEADVGLGFSLPRTPELRQSAVGRFRIGSRDSSAGELCARKAFQGGRLMPFWHRPAVISMLSRSNQRPYTDFRHHLHRGFRHVSTIGKNG
jgi:DNA-binding transcriptional LysR family regulator